MGGNLFNKGRISATDYLKIEKKIRGYLDKKMGNNYLIPRYYKNKQDFGDLDIIINLQGIKNKNSEELRQEIVRDLNIQEYKSNGRVFSTLYDNFQIDYFVTEEKFFISTYNYLSFNDLGNLIGKICRRFNLKYGERGLAYVYRRLEGNYKKDLFITTDFPEICKFLKLDYSQWELGFNTLEEMFAWIVECPYFSLKPYTEIAATFNRKIKQRPTLQKFLDYLHNNKIEKTYNYLENKDEYLPLIDRSFPQANILSKIQQEKELDLKNKKIKTKFNGRLIMELLPDLSGKELGEFIIKFKQQITDFDRFILESHPEEIKQAILTYYLRSIYD